MQKLVPIGREAQEKGENRDRDTEIQRDRAKEIETRVRKKGKREGRRRAQCGSKPTTVEPYLIPRSVVRTRISAAESTRQRIVHEGKTNGQVRQAMLHRHSNRQKARQAGMHLLAIVPGDR